MFLSDGRVIEIDLDEMIKVFEATELSVFKGKKILVTGSTGLVGLYVICALKHMSDEHDLGIRLYGSSRNTKSAKAYFSKYLDEPGIEFVEFGHEEHVAPFDYIFHAASSTNPVDLLASPLSVIEANVHHTGRLLRLLSNEIGVFVFFSTREIYGKKVDPQKTYIKEDDYGVVDPLDLRSAYPESKRLAENMIVSFTAQFGNPYRIFRISHTYGPGIKLNDGRVLSDIIGSMVNDKDIHLKSDGSHVVSPTYITDVIAGVFAGVMRGQDGCYNVSNHNEIYSVYDIATTAVANCPRSKVFRQSAPADSSLYLKHDTGILSSDKILGLLGAFRVPLDEGLRRVYNHHKTDR